MKSQKHCKHKEKPLCTKNLDEFIQTIKNRLFVQQQTIDEIVNKVSSLGISSIKEKQLRGLVTKRNGMFS